MQSVFSLVDKASTAANFTFNSSTNASGYHLSSTKDVLPFFSPGLSALAMIVHLITHPKIRDWLQLLALGVVATFTRIASKNVSRWLRYTFSMTSIHLMNDESYDWLMGKV